MRDRYALAALSSILGRLDQYDRGDRDRPGSSVDERLLRQLKTQMEKMMASLQETMEKIRHQGDRLDALITYHADLKTRLDAALAGELSAEKQAQVDAIFAEASENVGKIDQVLNAEAPPAVPLPPEAPTPVVENPVPENPPA